jgi:hypothetical protein
MGRVSPQDFRTAFGEDLSDGEAVAVRLLRDALRSEVPDEVECSIIVADHLRGFSASCVESLAELLRATWHTRHEDIARVLQDLADSRAVDALFEAATRKLPYLEYDQGHALARKCTWALATIGTPEAFDRLERLARCGDEVVEGYARKRLHKT